MSNDIPRPPEDDLQKEDLTLQKPKSPESKDEPSELTQLLENSEHLITPERQNTIQQILSSTENPENNTQVLQAVKEQLEEWGFKPTDIHRESLAIESQNDETIAAINELVTAGKMPTQNYTSNVGFYGLKAIPTVEGIEYQNGSTLINGLENRLRVSGDKGGSALDFFRKGIRKRGTVQQVAENIKKLDLENHFTITENSIIEKTQDIANGFILDDLLRLKNSEGNEFLKNFDNQKAIQISTEMIASIHKQSESGIGELLGNDIIINVEDKQMEKARLTLPDFIYSKETEKLEQQATDILDFLFSIGSAGLQTGGKSEAEKNIETALRAYINQDSDMIMKAIKALMDQGRPHCTMHNKVRFGFDRVKDKDEAFKMIHTIIQEML